MSWFKRLFSNEKSVASPVEERTVLNLKIGDIITYDLQDYQVVGKLSYNDHGFTWLAYQLQGEDHIYWLSVEVDDELELGMYEKVKLKVDEPIPDEIMFQEETFHLEEKGKANVQGEGRGKNVDGQVVQYFDYSNEEEEKFLSLEKWGSEIEVSVGESIGEYEIKIIAGSK